MTEIIKIQTEESVLQNTIEKFLTLVEEVPWGNSDWQNQQTIINRELTPERAYRHASIRLMAKLRELRATYFAIRKENIQIKKLKRQIAIEQDDLERELLQLEIEKILSMRPETEKMLKDTIQEIRSLAPIIEKMGKLTREQFEAAEPEHFRLTYHNQAIGKTDPLIGLEVMGIDLTTKEKRENFKTLFESITQDIKKLT